MQGGNGIPLPVKTGGPLPIKSMASDRDWKGNPVATEDGVVPVLVSISPSWIPEEIG
jgi:hypothetical protein